MPLLRLGLWLVSSLFAPHYDTPVKKHRSGQKSGGRNGDKMYFGRCVDTMGPSRRVRTDAGQIVATSVSIGHAKFICATWSFRAKCLAHFGPWLTCSM